MKIINRKPGTEQVRVMKKSRTFLVVDDAKAIVDGLIFILPGIGKGNKAIYAHNYHDAVRLLNTEKIDVAILDIHLPGKSGLDILRFIKEKKLPVEPIIIMSSNFRRYDKEKCFALGADYVIDKFDDLEKIKEIVSIPTA